MSQRLTDYIFLGPHADEREHDAARRIALMIRALNTLRDSLDEYYNKLKPVGKDDKGDKHHAKRRKLLEGMESPTAPGEFRGKEPTFSTFLHDGAEYQLKYIRRLVPYNDKVVFLAAATRTGTEGAEGDIVVVKFAKTYGKEAHALLEQHDPPLAPRLWYCEPVKQLGGLWMVVMDHVENCGALDEGGKDSVKKAIDVLHAQGLVFGDLRLPNVLISKNGPMLVDFDWSGKEGTAVYPASINMGIHWPEGVRGGAPLRASHDNLMLQRLLD